MIIVPLKKTKPDTKDLAIISALNHYGPRTKTSELSKILGISARTLRSRLKWLRDYNYLKPVYPLIHERKLGLGDCLILIQESYSFPISHLLQILKSIPYFYLLASTYGKFTGILVLCIYSLKSPNIVDTLLTELKSVAMIQEYQIFDLMDHATFAGDLTFFDPHKGWIWSWNEWQKEMSSLVKSDDYEDILDLTETPSQIDFDEKDILILKTLKECFHSGSPPISLVNLGKILDLSDKQAGRRKKRLEDEGVIRGYMTYFTYPYHEELIFTYTFLEFKSEKDIKVISLLSKLPFQIDIFMESKKKYCIFFRTTLKDLAGYLRTFEVFKQFLCSYYVQFVPFYYDERHHLYESYNKKIDSWDTPIDEYIELIRSINS